MTISHRSSLTLAVDRDATAALSPASCAKGCRAKLCTGLFSGLLALSLVTAQAQNGTAAASAPPVAAPNVRYPDFADLTEQISPSVVNIRTTERKASNVPQAGGGGWDEDLLDLFRRFGILIPGVPRGVPRGAPPSPDDDDGPAGVASGFFISRDGFIMTNAHVVTNASEVLVTLQDKREFKAKVIGADTRSDVAVVKIEGSNFPPVRIGDVGKLRAGEWVIAIGSPFGLENSVTAGIVSAKQRETGSFLPFIQSDVAINPGNSGGPLVNMRGEVVGINSMIYSRSGGSVGVSFSIPIDEAMRIGTQLRTTGKVQRGRIGVTIAPVSKEVAESLGLGKDQGALVEKVESGGPAEKAGILAGDVIVKANGVAIEKNIDLPRIIAAIKPGTRIPLSVFRNGSTRELSVLVDEFKDEVSARTTPERGSAAPPSAGQAAFGLRLQGLSEDRKKEMGLQGGVLVQAVSGVAAQAGIQPGDVILGLNNSTVNNLQDFETIANKADRSKAINVLVRRNDRAQFLILKPVK